jgi:hydrogenase nickel incorporation protein HypA/HybF
MHEIGYCEALLPAVERRADGRTVRRIGIRAGTRHRLVPDVMQVAWSQTAADTPYADAVTVLDETPMTAECTGCGHRFETADTLAECPECGVIGPRLSGGDEFALAWIEYADSVSSAPERTDEALAAPPHGGH